MARRTSKAVRQFAEACGIEKPAVSERFIRVSRRKVREFDGARLVEAGLMDYGKVRARTLFSSPPSSLIWRS